MALGAVCYAHQRLTGTDQSDGSEQSDRSDGSDQADLSDLSEQAEQGECCGMHITCERDSLLTAASADNAPVYFDDEELDIYAGRPADGYTAAETEQFRDVLLTLLPEDIAPWARSVQQRGITLPADIRDELLLIVAEARQAKFRV